MLTVENVEVYGFEPAIRGMRNPMNSWDKSDSYDAVDCGKCGLIEEKGFCIKEDRLGRCDNFRCYAVGDNDMKLMQSLFNAGTEHRKYDRMIQVWMDIEAPLYWWKEFDTYKVGTVANSCSTMHKIADKEFTLDDFSHEHIPLGSDAYSDTWDFKTSNMFFPVNIEDEIYFSSEDILDFTIQALNHYRKKYLETKDKTYWWQMIQLLPSSYNQKRTVMMNYEVCARIIEQRSNHKLDEWLQFVEVLKDLPYIDQIVRGSE